VRRKTENGIFPGLTPVLAVFAACGFFLSCGRPSVSQTEIPGSGLQPSEAARQTREEPGPGAEKRLARELARAMTIEEKCAQLLMIAVGIRPEVPEDFARLVRDVPAGAILLLGYNIAESPEKIMKLNAAFQEIAATAGKGVPFLIALDHEGGTVYRLGEAATRVPGASRIGALLQKADGTPNAPAFAEDILALYTASARQLSLLGFSLNLAPVLEPLNAANREFLRYRSYGADPRIVSLAGGIFIRAMREGGVLAAGKHFPGTGSGDPHEALTRLETDLSEGGEETPEILPFREAVADAGLSALMVSHVLAPGLDPLLPVSLSAPALSFIRRRLGFAGIILTDDINMKAVSAAGGAGEAAVAAIAAGADMIMYLDERGIAAVHADLVRAAREGRLPPERLEEAAARILEQKIMLNLWKTGGELRRAAEDGQELSRRVAAFSRLQQESSVLLKKLNRTAP
jgi:beta-N-acetylhexosaminidase